MTINPLQALPSPFIPSGVFSLLSTQNVASAALFLAAKVEEQPQKLEYVARVYYACINRDHPNIDPSSEVSMWPWYSVLSAAHSSLATSPFSGHVALKMAAFEAWHHTLSVPT